MFNDSVAQYPTIPVSPGKKNFQNSEDVWNLEGVARIGPRPCAACMAQYNNASAAIGKKNALKTSSFRILSTPSLTTHIFRSQKRINEINGPVCRPTQSGKMCGRVSID